MTLSTLVDLTKVTILSVGTGPLLLGAAVPGFRGQEALVTGNLYTYSIQQGANYELGTGTYDGGAGTLTRGVILSSYGNAAIPLTPNGICTFTVMAADLRVPGPPGNPGAPGGPGNPGNPGANGTVIYSGLADPTVGVGAVGDFYINTTSAVLFGPKTNSGTTPWASFVSIKGTNADYAIAGFAVGAITASEILTDHIVVRACSFAANFAGSQCSVGTNPAATFTLTVSKNGATVGTISIATSGAVTFSTTGGTAVVLAIGDVVTVTAQAGADASIARLRYTLKGA